MKYRFGILLSIIIVTLTGCGKTADKSDTTVKNSVKMDYLRDGDLLSPASTTPINKNESNTAPVAQSMNLTTKEDSATVAFHLTGKDRDGDPIYYKLDKAPKNGKLQGSAAHLIYTPNPNFNGTDSFSYIVSDGTVDSDVATVTIQVTPINDAPQWLTIPSEKSVALANQPFRLDLKNYVSDIDGDPIAWSVKNLPTWLTLSKDGVLSGTPSEDDVKANIRDYITTTFTASDGTASPTNDFTFQVKSTQHTPVANDDQLQVREKEPGSINLLVNDTDSDIDDTLRLTEVRSIDTPPIPNELYKFDANGTLIFEPEDYFNNLKADELRELHFTYTILDQHGNQAQAHLTITIKGINDAPQGDFKIINSTTTGVELDASTSVDLDGNITDYKWEENGNVLTPNSGTAQHPIFTLTSGVHDIKLIITDDKGAQSSYSDTIQIKPTTPTNNDTNNSNTSVSSGLTRISHITIGDFDGNSLPDIAATDGQQVIWLEATDNSFIKHTLPNMQTRTIYSTKLDSATQDSLIIADNNLSICQYNQTEFVCTKPIYSKFRSDDKISDIKVANIFGETQPQIFTTSLQEKTINVFTASSPLSYKYSKKYSNLLESQKVDTKFNFSDYEGAFPNPISIDIGENGEIVDANQNGQIHILKKQGSNFTQDLNITLPHKVKKVAFCGDKGVIAYAYDTVQQDAYLYFKSINSTSFQKIPVSHDDTIDGTFICKDIDNDQSVDLLGAFDNQISIWKYDTTSDTFINERLLITHTNTIKDMKAADMNKDGTVDIVIGDSSGDITTYLMTP